MYAEQSRRSPRRKLGVANPGTKRRRPLADLDNNVILAFKHGMQLRSRSGSVSPTKSALKKKPSPPPVIVRPDSAVDALSSETIVLRPKLKSSPTRKPEEKKDSPPPAHSSELKPSPAKDSPPHSSELKPSPTKIPEDRPVKFCERPENIKKWAAERERVKAQMEYIDERSIPATGFTVWEYTICSHYMWRRDFEDEDPIPSQHQYFKAVMDQVRATRGYGVTLRCGGINTGFTPLMGQLENDPKVRELADEMIKMVLGAIKRKMRKKYTSRGVEKLVKSFQHYFLTLGVSDPTATHQIVEALFLRSHMGNPKNFLRFEWKIKQGAEVIFTTSEILES